jgi:hypothetical protein
MSSAPGLVPGGPCEPERSTRQDCGTVLVQRRAVFFLERPDDLRDRQLAPGRKALLPSDRSPDRIRPIVCLVGLVAFECEQHRERFGRVNAVIHDQYASSDRVAYRRLTSVDPLCRLGRGYRSHLTVNSLPRPGPALCACIC